MGKKSCLIVSVAFVTILNFSSPLLAGELAVGKIEEVVTVWNWNNNSGRNFAIRMDSSATGVCSQVDIVFQENNYSGNLNSYQQSFSLASTAFVTEKTIRAVNPSGSSCTGARGIEIVQ